jgi:hypothetical protein
MAALPEAQLDQPRLAGEYFGRKLAAVFAGHRPFDRLDDSRSNAAVIVELFGAVVHCDPGTPADVLVIGAFVRTSASSR